MLEDREQVAKSGEARVYTLEDGRTCQLFHQLQEAGQQKTRAEIAAYIAAQERSATDFERHAWLLFAMWNETRSQEMFFLMVLTHWADATRYLHDTPAPDVWAQGCERDQRLTQELLSWVGISPSPVTQRQLPTRSAFCDMWKGGLKLWISMGLCL